MVIFYFLKMFFQPPAASLQLLFRYYCHDFPSPSPTKHEPSVFSYLHNSALSLFRNDRLMFDEREFIKLPKKILMEKSTLCFHIPKRFWSILLEHFIKHKPVNLSEGCSILSTKKIINSISTSCIRSP